MTLTTEAIVLGLAIAFLIGWAMSSMVTRFRMIRYIAKKLEEDGYPGEELVDRVNIKVEKHGEELFAYQLETNVFLSKAPDGEKLVANLEELFHNRKVPVRISIHVDDGAEYIQQYFK